MGSADHLIKNLTEVTWLMFIIHAPSPWTCRVPYSRFEWWSGWWSMIYDTIQIAPLSFHFRLDTGDALNTSFTWYLGESMTITPDTFPGSLANDNQAVGR